MTLSIGTQTNGQGHATAYSQFVAEKLNIDIDKVIVHQGDTDQLKAGGGTGGSRSIPLGGVSAARAGEDLAEKIKRIAADELEASAADIELVDGTARIVGTDRSMDFAAIAKAAKKPDDLEGFRRVRAGRVHLSERHAYLRGRDRSGDRRDGRSSTTPSSTISA